MNLEIKILLLQFAFTEVFITCTYVSQIDQGFVECLCPLDNLYYCQSKLSKLIMTNCWAKKANILPFYHVIWHWINLKYLNFINHCRMENMKTQASQIHDWHLPFLQCYYPGNVTLPVNNKGLLTCTSKRQQQRGPQSQLLSSLQLPL